MKTLGTYRNGNYNVAIFNDGTKIRETRDDYFLPNFAENIDVCITKYCDMNCPMCHEGASVFGDHGDILNESFVQTLHPYQEIAIGGGNALSHPDLVPFLKILKQKKVVANLTVHQKHFIEYENFISELYEQKLIHGLGVSLFIPNADFINRIARFPDAVIHVIAGVFSENDYKALRQRNIKLLILGYKKLRKGKQYFVDNCEMIARRLCWLKSILPKMMGEFSLVSFDNLALNQLNVKNTVSKNVWNSCYMGDDGTSTFYIDAVNKEFSASSSDPLSKRYKLMDDVDSMFDYIRAYN